eukprot:scaffold43944_cov59-Attheya_sp.AAC.14
MTATCIQSTFHDDAISKGSQGRLYMGRYHGTKEWFLQTGEQGRLTTRIRSIAITAVVGIIGIPVVQIQVLQMSEGTRQVHPRDACPAS